jgi:hypothetical protein
MFRHYSVKTDQTTSWLLSFFSKTSLASRRREMSCMFFHVQRVKGSNHINISSLLHKKSQKPCLLNPWQYLQKPWKVIGKYGIFWSVGERKRCIFPIYLGKEGNYKKKSNPNKAQVTVGCWLYLFFYDHIFLSI